MLLQDLLSELRLNLLHDRSDRIDGSADDTLWSDDTLIRYIDEAQRKLAREGLVIRDGSTAEVTRVTLVAGQAQYTLHSSVLAVISAKYDTDQRDLVRVGHWFLAGNRMPDPMVFDVNQVSVLTPGRPIAYSTDEEVVNDDSDSAGVSVLRVFPTPTSDEAGKIIYMRVIRLPIERLSKKRLKLAPEVPEENHLEMLDWAAYLALRIQDQDAGNRAAAGDFEARFNALLKRAQRNAMRKLFAPTGWGFGRGGFTWER